MGGRRGRKCEKRNDETRGAPTEGRIDGPPFPFVTLTESRDLEYQEKWNDQKKNGEELENFSRIRGGDNKEE